MLWLAPAFLFILGTCIGSFVNVAVLRFGFDERSSPRSACMACGHTLRARDLVPLFSYAALRGRCRDCGSRLSPQYPLVELATGISFALAAPLIPATVSLFPLLSFAALLVFLAALIGATAYDLRHTLVPLDFIWVLLAAAAVASLAQALAHGTPEPLIDSALGGGAIFAFFFAVVFVTKGRGMGIGDGYVAGAGGIVLGFFRGIEAVMLAVWSATIVYLALYAAAALSSALRGGNRRSAKGQVTMKTEVPFVPFIAFGILLGLFTTISPLEWGTAITAFVFSLHL